MPDRCLRCKQIRLWSTDDLWAKLKQASALTVSLSCYRAHACAVSEKQRCGDVLSSFICAPLSRARVSFYHLSVLFGLLQNHNKRKIIWKASRWEKTLTKHSQTPASLFLAFERHHAGRKLWQSTHRHQQVCFWPKTNLLVSVSAL